MSTPEVLFWILFFFGGPLAFFMFLGYVAHLGEQVKLDKREGKNEAIRQAIRQGQR